jgi:hypothetical protein
MPEVLCFSPVSAAALSPEAVPATAAAAQQAGLVLLISQQQSCPASTPIKHLHIFTTLHNLVDG